MDIYKQAALTGLRFTTSKGSLSAEQLYHLTQTDLTNAIRNQKKVLKKNDDDDLGFLDTNSKVDAVEQLRFDILKDVYITKKEAAAASRTALERKEQQQKLMGLIQKKKEGALENLSVEELEKMLAEA